MARFQSSPLKGGRITYRCSFCGKSQEQIARLIAGPGGVYICDQCVALCQEIIQEEPAAQCALKHTPDQAATDQAPSEHQRSEPVPGRCPECRTRLIFAESTDPVTLKASGTAQLIQRSGLWAVVCPQCGFTAFLSKDPRKLAPETE